MKMRNYILFDFGVSILILLHIASMVLQLVKKKI